jgi:hypothetical protein
MTNMLYVDVLLQFSPHVLYLPLLYRHICTYYAQN